MLIDLNPPPTEPVTLAEAKTFLRVDHAYEDALINTLITAARERLESHLNIAMILRPMQISQACGGEIKLPRWPVTQVNSVVADGDPVTDFTGNLRSRPATVTVPDAQSSEITFTAGFGPTPDLVPAPLRQAVLLLVSRGYEHRNVDPDTLPLMVDALTMPYRMIGL